MRDIKFRVWRFYHREERHKFYYTSGPYMVVNSGATLVFPTDKNLDWVDDTVMEVEESAVQQFTGLKDKNGKEIYEGDIVFADETTFEVVFKYGCFMVRNVDLGVETDEVSQQYFTPLYEYPDCEVIGNIFKK